tara:strand:- start:343 stop:969 length:627 start_codon:yes stop_codon:yes gene_type:complete
MKTTKVINIGSGNIKSIVSVLEKNNTSYEIVENSESLNDENTSSIILPGVGSFPSFMKNLVSKNFDKKIKFLVLEKNIKILGICVGFQALFESSNEIEYTSGLSILKGNIKKISESKEILLPHIGWNNCILNNKNKSKIFNRIDDMSNFYFCHTYALHEAEDTIFSSKTIYDNHFISSVSKDNIYGVQFHPEKSQTNGILLMKNFLEI